MLYFNMYSDAPPFFFPVNRYGTALVMKVLLFYSLSHKAGYFYVSGMWPVKSVQFSTVFEKNFK